MAKKAKSVKPKKGRCPPGYHKRCIKGRATRKTKSKGKKKGRCLKWSKGRTRCLKRAKR